MNMTKKSGLLHPNGTLNIKPKGISFLNQSDVHNMLVTMSWLSFFVLIAIIFISVNILFTLLYLLVDPAQITGILKFDFWGHVFEVFFFSTQTITTVGYGRVSPVGIEASAIAAVESMLGVILFAFISGMSYARFARPRPKIVYSKYMVVGPYQGTQALMVRTVNYKKNQLVDLTAEIILTVNIKVEGKPTRFFYTLPLEQEKMGMMMMSWVIVHKITEDSALYGLSAADLESSDAEVLIMIKGSDDILSQNVYSRTSFKASRIIWGAEFVSINEIDEVGNLEIDISRMHETRKVSNHVI